MAVSLKLKIKWGYVIAFLMLIISYVLIFYIISKLVSQSESVADSYEAINKLESIKGEITDAETGMRGFIISGDDRFLDPYNSGSKNVVTYFQEFRKARYNVNGSNSLIDTLGALITHRLSRLSGMIDAYRANGNVLTPAMRVNRENNRRTMEQIRVTVKALQDREYQTMRERNEKLNSFFNSTWVITITSLVVVIFTILFSLIVYVRESRLKEQADEVVKSSATALGETVQELDRANMELEELRSLEKFTSTGRIARTIAHEVRNPLTNISLASEQLRDLLEKSEEGELLLNMISRNSNRINQLVSDLLNSTRFAQLEYAPANINDILEEALGQARDRIDLNHVTISKVFDKGLRELKVDREKLKLAFLNIIVNAIEAMPKNEGILHVITRRSNDKYIIEFKDNGSGMDEETLQKLFEPYFTNKLKGNGLGLTNTQNVILNHKGFITVRSKVGEGTVFMITLNSEELKP